VATGGIVRVDDTLRLRLPIDFIFEPLRLSEVEMDRDLSDVTSAVGDADCDPEEDTGCDDETDNVDESLNDSDEERLVELVTSGVPDTDTDVPMVVVGLLELLRGIDVLSDTVRVREPVLDGVMEAERLPDGVDEKVKERLVNVTSDVRVGGSIIVIEGLGVLDTEVAVLEAFAVAVHEARLLMLSE
jgi:hypothetical protein